MEGSTILRPISDAAVAAAELCHVNRPSSRNAHRQLSTPSPSPKAPPSIPRSPFLCSTTSLQGRFLSSGLVSSRKAWNLKALRSAVGSAVGENPDWSDGDYLVLGLAHCFQQESGSLKDVFLIEPLTASATECLENGGATSYKHLTGSSLGAALKFDVSILPSEFSSGQFCGEFDFRAKCAARTWKRTHAVDNLMQLVPVGTVRSEFNFSLADKRVLNKERVVTDADNIKQDMSIDVYGRSSETAEDQNSEIASLYNA